MTRLVIFRTLAIAMICLGPLFYWYTWHQQRNKGPLTISAGFRGEIIPLTEAGEWINIYRQPGDWINQHGKPVTLQRFEGKAALSGFIYTNCVDTCSLLTLRMKEVELRLPEELRDRVQFMMFSIDPERDTPGQLKLYASRFEANSGNWHFLTAHDSTVHKLAKRFSFSYQKEGSSFIHNDMLALLDREGNLRSQFWGQRHPDEILVVIDKMKQSGTL